MTISELGSLGELISSIAVFATLVYLAIQIRQSNGLAKARTREHMATLTIAELMKFSDDSNSWANLLLDRPLTHEQKVKLNFQLLAMIRRQEFDWWQFKNGLLDEESYRASQIHLYDTFRIPSMQSWWEHLGREGHFSDSLIAEIDRIIKEVKGTENAFANEVWDRWTHNADNDA